MEEHDHEAKRRRIARASLTKPFKSPLARRKVLSEQPPNRLHEPSTDPDPETGDLMRQKRHLEQKVRETKARIEVVKQASRYHDGKEDEKLDALAEKWRAAAQQAAEHLHGGAVDRIHRMGGEEVWRENLRQKRLDAQRFQHEMVQEENADDGSEEALERRRMREAATPPPIEAIPEPEIPQAYSMKVTLMQLHVDLHAIRFDEATDTWKQ